MSRRVIGLAAVLLVVSAFAACSRDPQKIKVAAVAKGDTYAAQGKYSEAIIEYRKAVAADAMYGPARLKLGVAYLAVADPRSALSELVRAADLMPENVDAQLRAGSLLLQAGQYQEAKARAVTALAKDPKSAPALMLMGNALAGLKSFDEAIDQVQGALDADPRLALGYANLGLFQLAKGERANAEDAFKRAVEIDPKSVPAHLNLANFYWAGGKIELAEKEFQAAFRLDPKSSIAAQALAAFYVTNKRQRDAEPFMRAYSEKDAKAKLVLADYYISDRRVKEATAVLEPLVQQKDMFAPASVRLAAIQYSANNREAAYKIIDGVIAREPNNEVGLEMKARFLMNDGRYGDAIAVADTVIKQDGNALRSMYLRAVSLKLSGSSEKALAAFEELLKKVPADRSVQTEVAQLYLDRGDTKGAIDFLGGVTKANQKSMYSRYILAQAMLRGGDIDGAERQLTAISQAVPNSAPVLTWLGVVYAAKHDSVRSRAAYERAYKLSPNSPTVLAGMIGADISEHKFDDARNRVQMALRANPDDAQILLLAGNTYVAIGNKKEAEDTFEAVVRKDPTNLEAFSKLGLLYHTEGRVAEAKRKYEEVVKRQEHPSTALTLLGLLAELEHNQAEARAFYQKALEANPKAAVAANNLAWIYGETGENLDLALQFAQTAKSEIPDNAQVNDTLGWIYYKKGLAAQAVTFLRDASTGKPTDPDIQYRLGLAYIKAGDKKNARASLEKALKLNPSFSKADDAKRALESLRG